MIGSSKARPRGEGGETAGDGRDDAEWSRLRRRGLVLDDESPLVGLVQELGFERVCDAEWLAFVPECAGGGEGVQGGGRLASLAELAMCP